MSVEKMPCACGHGYFEFTHEMDDWNRSRSSKAIHCDACQAAHNEVLRERAENEQRREALLQRATTLASERHLSDWLATFHGLSKKSAWKRLTGGHGYPALATFYKHLQYEGHEAYFRRQFFQDIAKALGVMGTVDAEIIGLLAQRDAIPTHSDERRLPL